MISNADGLDGLLVTKSFDVFEEEMSMSIEMIGFGLVGEEGGSLGIRRRKPSG